MPLTFKCARCGETVFTPLAKDSTFCKTCLRKRKCPVCGRIYIPAEVPEARLWYDEDGITKHYTCSKECYAKRPLTCHRCKKKHSAAESFPLKGNYYCSEHCRDTVKCAWCHRECPRESAFNDKFCSPNCELMYYNVSDDKKFRQI